MILLNKSFTIRFLLVALFTVLFLFVLKPIDTYACTGCLCRTTTSTSCDCSVGAYPTSTSCSGQYTYCTYQWVRTGTTPDGDPIYSWICVNACGSCNSSSSGYTGSCSCCTPGNCGGCTPSCPTGQSTTVSGPLCQSGVSSCSGSNGCSSCTLTGGSCYLLETNTTFIQSNGSTSGPSSVSMIVDGKTYELSTDSENPTHIKFPASGSSNVQISSPTFTAPLTSRGANYYYQANNYGNINEWETWTTCSGVAGEDFCTVMPNANNIQTFIPTSKTVNQTLKEGATGEISAMYATTDKCDNTYKYSLPTKGYYVVDYIPDPPDPCTPGDPACTILPDVVSDLTSRGCSSLTYTGTEVNNGLHVSATVTDIDNINEIQAFTLWFSKDNTIPSASTISASYTGSITDDVGIMIKKNGSDWTNPNIYTTNSDLTWGLISLTDGVGYINVAATNIIVISNISVSESSEIIFDYELTFLDNDSNLSGMYNVYGGSLDTHMINGNILDQSYYYELFDWGIDLVDPTVEEITQQIRDPQNTYMTWSNADTISGIGRTVVNAYRLGGVSTDPEGIKLYLPTAYTTLKGAIILDPNAEIPSDQEIGLYNDPNSWIFNTNTGETDLVNVGNNESGQIALYITAYDVACNTNGNGTNIDLNPWFATRGATVYSQGNISSTSKDVAGLPYLDEVFNPKTGMNSNLIDLGTELLSTRNSTISNLLHSNSGATIATQKNDSNNIKDVWFNKLVKKFNQYKAQLTQFTITALDNAVSDSCTGSKCYMYSTENISIPIGYTCDRPTLFVSEKDIHISPDVLSDTSLLSGCVFLAKNNIYIDAGSLKSTSTKVMYDYIEGYMIADNQVIFSVADESQSLRDGVEIFGGVIALGTNPTSGNTGISIQRNLRLYSQINPTVVITYDNKYSSISTIFFGTEYNLYKQEVGFKTF